MMRGAATSGAIAAPCRRTRREISCIYRFQAVHHVVCAALVAGPWSLPCDVQVYNQPAFEGDRFQHLMAAGEIDIAIAEVEDAFLIEAVGLGGGEPLGIL